MKKPLIYSTYFVGEINLLLCYSGLFQSILIGIAGLLCIFSVAYIYLLLACTILALVITSFLIFASGATYLILASTKRILLGRNSTINPISRTKHEKHRQYIARFKWISFTLLLLFLILLYAFTYPEQHQALRFVNNHTEGCFIGLASILLLTSTCFITYKRIKSQLNLESREPAKEEFLILKVRSDHRACIIGQLIYLPYFLFFMYVVSEVS